MSNDRYVSRVGSFAAKVRPCGPGGWFSESGTSGTPYVRLPLVVTDKGDQEGKEIIWAGWLTDAAFDNTVKALAKAFPGWNGDLEALSNGGFSFEGMDCAIVTESEPYNGEDRIKVKWLNAAGGGGGKALEKTKLNSILQKMGRKSIALAKSAREESGATATTKPTGPQISDGQPGDDEIPY